MKILVINERNERCKGKIKIMLTYFNDLSHVLQLKFLNFHILIFGINKMHLSKFRHSKMFLSPKTKTTFSQIFILFLINESERLLFVVYFLEIEQYLKKER